jgi:tetratricopeptide (TPR) repeat protein
MGRAGSRSFFGACWVGVLLILAGAAVRPAPAIAAPQGTGQTDVATRVLLLEHDAANQKNETQAAIQAAKDITQKDIARIEAQQHEVDARMDDLKSRISDLSYILTAIGLIVGFGAYFAADQRAKAVAKTWMDDHATDLQKQITELKKLADGISERIANCVVEVEDTAKSAKEKIGGHEREAQEAAARVQDVLRADRPDEPTGKSLEITQRDQEVLKQADDALKAKAEKDYTAKDWAQRAYAAVAENAYERAALYFHQAADAAYNNLAEWAKYTINRGVALGSLNRSEEEMAVYDAVVARLGDAAEPVLREGVARTLFNKGVTLGNLNRSEEAIAVYDAIVARFDDAPEAVLCEQVAKALVNKGAALGRLNRSEEAVAVYDDVVARFGDVSDAILREAVARALVNKGVALGRLNRNEEAVAAFDAVVTRVGDASEAALRERVAKALFIKGVALSKLKRSEEAIATFNSVVARFGNSEDVAIKKIVGKAVEMRRLLEK